MIPNEQRPPRQVHILNLVEGDLYRYTADGPVFRIAVERDENGKVVRHLAQHSDGSRCQLWAVVDYAGCYVYPLDPQEEAPHADELP